jgi:hypothetical protein
MLFTLQNQYISMVFDDQKKQFISIENRINHDQILKRAVQTPLCQLTCLDKDTDQKQVYIPSGKVQVSQREKELEIRFEQVSRTDDVSLPVRVHVIVSLADERSESVWTLRLENHSEQSSIVEVLFPYLRGIYLGESWQDDTIIYPHHAGEKTLAPISEYVSERYLHLSRAGTLPVGDHWQREINYCGLASMQWMYYYDPKGGLYFGSHDDSFVVTGLSVETGGPQAAWMGFAYRKYHRIQPGETWNSAPYVLALTTEDWHWGARRYRFWIDPYLDILPNPEFLADESVLTKCYALKREGKVIQKYDQLPKVFDGGRKAFNSKHLFVASWNRGGFDTDYPEYQPDMDLGSPMDLWKACQQIRGKGGHITFYINSRIFDTSSSYYKTQGNHWAIKDETGKTREEHYDWVRNFSVSCPAESGWQNYLMDIACWMVKSYGAKGIYLDQLGSAEPFPCFDRSHSHADIGDFNHGYLTILKELRARLKELDPDTYLMIENCGDIYSQYLWGNLVWNGDPYDEFFNLYKYTFPEYTYVHMVNPITDLEPAARKERFYRDMERATLLGSIFWLGLEKFFPGDEDLLAYAKKVVPFREKITPLIKHARYLDDEQLSRVDDGLQVSHWHLEDGRELYIVGNIYEAAHKSFTFENAKGTLAAIESINIDDVVEPVAYSCHKDQVTIQVQPHTLAYFLLSTAR